uniref:Uncharacterized protein n=1 Tax=Anopheles farauti TaxID=69004 RepID=A0A182QDY1_9DIPT
MAMTAWTKAFDGTSCPAGATSFGVVPDEFTVEPPVDPGTYSSYDKSLAVATGGDRDSSPSSISRFTYVPLMFSASSLGLFLRNRAGDMPIVAFDVSAVAIMTPLLPTSTLPPTGIPSIDFRRNIRPRIGLASAPTWANSRSITLCGGGAAVANAISFRSNAIVLHSPATSSSGSRLSTLWRMFKQPCGNTFTAPPLDDRASVTQEDDGADGGVGTSVTATGSPTLADESLLSFPLLPSASAAFLTMFITASPAVLRMLFGFLPPFRTLPVVSSRSLPITSGSFPPTASKPSSPPPIAASSSPIQHDRFLFVDVIIILRWQRCVVRFKRLKLGRAVHAEQRNRTEVLLVVVRQNLHPHKLPEQVRMQQKALHVPLVPRRKLTHSRVGNRLLTETVNSLGEEENSSKFASSIRSAWTGSHSSTTNQILLVHGFNRYSSFGAVSTEPVLCASGFEAIIFAPHSGAA